MGEIWAIIDKFLKTESQKKLWDGLFIKPVSGVTTMPFGTYELIGRRVRRHRGWDFRATLNTPVKAANSGLVVYTSFLKAFGGTVVVDHGQGIYTLYFHLSKILVSPGQLVALGDILGLSGSSGIASGPHLHWGMSVHDVRIDPRQWVITVMP